MVWFEVWVRFSLVLFALVIVDGFLIKTSADNRRKPKDTQHLGVDWNKHASKQSNYPSESHNKIMALVGPCGDDDGGGAH